jgi:hypothetical protein
MGPAMRICLALAAVAALGALGGGLALAFHDGRASAGRLGLVAGRKASPAATAAAQASPTASRDPAPGYSLSTLDDASDLTFNQLLGINNRGHIAGYFGSGTAGQPRYRARSHGFTWTQRHGFTTVDGPAGAVDTTINGVNNAGELVGSYVTRGGTTDGLLARPLGLRA